LLLGSAAWEEVASKPAPTDAVEIMPSQLRREKDCSFIGVNNG